MKFKKLLLLGLVMVLICAISITGTLAYLTADTEAVTNTFVAASGLVSSLTLDESKANPDSASGLYTLDVDDRVTENSYTVLPETTLPKDPVVHVIGRTSTPAFLYIEVVDNTGDCISFDIRDVWTDLKIEGPNEGKVYQYTGPAMEIKDPEKGLAGNTDIYILEENEITVSEDLEELTSTSNTIEFYAYMAQASIDGYNGAAEIFTACFNS